MKKAVSFFLAVCLLIGLFSASALNVGAAAGGSVGDCRWELNGTELVITGSGSMGYCAEWPWGKHITKVTVGEGVVTIGMSAFTECRDLKQVVLPETLKPIENFAFSACSSLYEIEIPKNVFYIGTAAFEGCDKLIEINIPENVTEIGPDALTDCDNMMRITVDSGNKNYRAEDGVLFNKNKTTLIRYPSKKPASSYDIPDTVTRIEHNAFLSAWYLADVTIPDSVTYIGINPFFQYADI